MNKDDLIAYGLAAWREGRFKRKEDTMVLWRWWWFLG
jgi:hypothetical protein